MHAGNGPGLTSRLQGLKTGTETHTITTNNMPSHSHTMNLASSIEGDQTSPVGNTTAVTDDRNYVNDPAATQNTGLSGGGQAVNHMPPFTTVRYIIALQGIFPSRN